MSGEVCQDSAKEHGVNLASCSTTTHTGIPLFCSHNVTKTMPGGIGYLLINGIQDHAPLRIMRPEEMTLLFLWPCWYAEGLMPMEIGFHEMEHMQ